MDVQCPLADARQSGPAGPLVEHPVCDRRVPARQPGSGKAKGLRPYADPERSTPRCPCRARKGVGRVHHGLRYVPFPPERVPVTGAPIMQRSIGDN